MADLGAGVGFFVRAELEAVGENGRVYLVDPDASNLAIAARRVAGDARVLFLVSSANRLDAIPDATVDRALLSLVLCCLVDKEGTMDELWRILAPGGIALITYPKLGVPFRRRKRSMWMRRERWASLLARRPWKELPVSSGWAIARHLIEKPTHASTHDASSSSGTR
ncbi:MAG: class I SAM-dependent methyltransferase [Thermoplasmata archaeon]|nr:class I SAM-dependent methyltransferase [Thermoplasmata archaeon]